MVYDYRKLKGRIREMYGTQDNFAEKLGIGRVSLFKRLTNKLEFSQAEIKKSCELLNIEPENVSLYFFTLKV